MNTEMYQTPMEVAVYQLHNFSISFFSSLLGGDVVSVKLDNSASGASVVAIDNKIEQAMVSGITASFSSPDLAAAYVTLGRIEGMGEKALSQNPEEADSLP
ncbi:TSC22D3 isoform 15, partial [Pan troglodytes]